MRRSLAGPRSALSAPGRSLLVPASATADTCDAAGDKGVLPDSVGINTMWVIVAGVLVMFMQAGFVFLEIGFSRGKNAGTVVAKILTNFSIAAICCTGRSASRSRSAATAGQRHRRRTGSSCATSATRTTAFPVMGLSDATIEAKFFFQFVFCAVSLAIVWGSTLERIKFGVYIIYAVVFSAIIYPIVAHWVFGGGLLQAERSAPACRTSPVRRPSTSSARPAAFAVLLLLGPRQGQVRRGRQAAGDPRAQHAAVRPRRHDPVARLVRVQPGLDAGALDGRFAEVVLVTNLAAAAGVLGALLTATLMQKTLDIGMVGNGAIAALVAHHRAVGLRRARGPRDHRPRRRRDRRRSACYAIDKMLDDPVGALTAHGLAASGARSSCGLFTLAALAQYNAVGDGRGLVYTGSFTPAGRAGPRRRRRVHRSVFVIELRRRSA